MKRTILTIAALALFLPVFAQGTVNDLESEFGARISAGADYKIVKGLHLTAEGEFRTRDNFSDVGRLSAGAGLTYKVNDWLKIGGGYVFMAHHKSSGSWTPRHRAYADATLSYKTDLWRFSLKERLQYTHKEVNNTYQTNPNTIALKSRLKVSYRGAGDFTPYGFIELRTVLNDPSCSATWDGSSYTNYSFTGYNDVYFNRYRLGLGTEWKLSKQHAFDFFILADYCYDKEIDTDSEGETLKSLTYDQTFAVSAGIGYVFSF